MPVAESAFHWQPVLSTKKMPSAHWRSGTRGRPPPKRCVFLCSGKSGSLNAQSSSLIVKRAPVLSTRLARGRERGLTSSAVFIPAKGTTKSVIRIGTKCLPESLRGGIQNLPEHHEQNRAVNICQNKFTVTGIP